MLRIHIKKVSFYYGNKNFHLYILISSHSDFGYDKKLRFFRRRYYYYWSLPSLLRILILKFV